VVSVRLKLALVACLAAGLAAPTLGIAAPPPGATVRCRDGTYSYSQHHSGTCSWHGGVAAWLDGSTSSSSSSPSSSAGSSSGQSCGVERWSVKTLQDRPTLLKTRRTTIHFLVSRRAPHPLPTTRLAFERHRYVVTAAVTLVRPEEDGDLHLVLQAGADQMIAESPSPSCDTSAPPLYRRLMTSARSRIRLCTRARITGVAFFDFNHGQTGVAPNAIELHPILGFRCLRG
jgi:Protein of unknown function (DUF3761)